MTQCPLLYESLELYTIPHNPKGKNGKSDIEPKNSCSGSEDTGKEACK